MLKLMAVGPFRNRSEFLCKRKLDSRAVEGKGSCTVNQCGSKLSIGFIPNRRPPCALTGLWFPKLTVSAILAADHIDCVGAFGHRDMNSVCAFDISARIPFACSFFLKLFLGKVGSLYHS
jgi:hypothetical protein